ETEYLSVPDGLAEGLNATAAHQQGITGKGVKVVIVDTGWYAHPYFEKHHYNVNIHLAPGSTDTCSDLIGHGTGIAANLLAIAPEADLTVVKADVAIAGTLKSVNSVSAFRAAINLNPNIISCSWASDQRSPRLSPANRVLAATVAYAVRQGITVVFSAGNGHMGFPSQHPDVIAVGGVYRHLQGSLKGTLEASNYASGFVSPVYPGRRVPDVCGLVGQLPYGCYIMLPVPPGSVIDQDLGSPIRNGTPSKDGTHYSDGWAAFSGTSAAAPQVAGVCALIKQVKSALSPAAIKQLLQQTAIDVLGGFSHPSSGDAAARDGPDLATGDGLVNAGKATMFSFQKSKEPCCKPHKSRSDSWLTSKNLSTLSTRSATMRDDFPQLCKHFDEIRVRIDRILKEEFIDLELIEEVELDLQPEFFIPRAPQADVVLELQKMLSSLPEESIAIEKKHILAAESLLRISRCNKLAIKVLIAGLSSSREEVPELASRALGEVRTLSSDKNKFSNLGSRERTPEECAFAGLSYPCGNSYFSK
ncbi:MAG TPA: S8 family serine peptidase, partial [Candidatus Obscuribacterales bacterium]